MRWPGLQGACVAELQEHFLWEDVTREAALIRESRDAIESELADVFIYLLAIADRLNTDLIAAADAKMARNERRFPVPRPEENE